MRAIIGPYSYVYVLPMTVLRNCFLALVPGVPKASGDGVSGAGRRGTLAMQQHRPRVPWCGMLGRKRVRGRYPGVSRFRRRRLRSRIHAHMEPWQHLLGRIKKGRGLGGLAWVEYGLSPGRDQLRLCFYDLLLFVEC